MIRDKNYFRFVFILYAWDHFVSTSLIKKSPLLTFMTQKKSLQTGKYALTRGTLKDKITVNHCERLRAIEQFAATMQRLITQICPKRLGGRREPIFSYKSLKIVRFITQFQPQVVKHSRKRV